MKIKLELNKKFIPVNVPRLFPQDKKNVIECLKTGWISSQGKCVKKFETNFSKFNNRKHGVAVSNGTAALEIALKSLNLKKNDEVIIPAFTIISSIICVLKLGLKPILVDSDINDWNMSVSETIKKINKKTKVIIVTHLYGFPVDMENILRISKKKNIKIIEDAAEMIGQKYKKKMCGSYGDISTFSFYANKHITTGEGGMVLTNNKKIYLKLKSLKNLCFGNKSNRFNHDDIGYNYRLTNLQAAIGCGQLENINWIVNRKMEIGRRYYNHLKNNPFFTIQKTSNKVSKNIYWIVGILVKNKNNLSKDKLIKKLLKKGIETRSFFYPMHKQKIVKKLNIYKKKEKFPVAEYLFKNGFYLPSGLGIKNSEIDYVCHHINKICK